MSQTEVQVADRSMLDLPGSVYGVIPDLLSELHQSTNGVQQVYPTD